MIVNAKYDQFGGITATSDLGVVMHTHEKSRFILEFLANGGIIEPADPIDHAPQNKDTAFRKLRDCDWTQLPDEQLLMTPQEELGWHNYRQALRGILNSPPNTPAHEIDWPVPPGSEK